MTVTGRAENEASAATRQAAVIPGDSSTTRRIYRWLPYLALLALYICCALLVAPRGEFPLNDDWSYTRSAFRFGSEGRMQVDEWSAPSLVGQALYGGALVRVFGRSFLALRLSTIVLSCLMSCLLWATFCRLEISSDLRWLAVLGWIFNPVYFSLSFTYMTEIPFLLCVTLALFLYVHYTKGGRPWLLPACGAALGYALLIRQTAVLFMLPMFVVLLYPGGRGKAVSTIRRVLLWTGPVVIFIAGYLMWSRHNGGSTPAARRKFELLAQLTSTQILGNAFGLLFYLAFFLLPLAIYLTPRLPGLCREVGSKAWWIAGVWFLIPGCGLWWFHARYAGAPYLPSRSFHDRMPYLLNILYDTGTGPVTLDPTYYGQPPTPIHPAIWLAVTFLCAGGALCLGLLLTISAIRFFRPGLDSGRRGPALLSGLSFLTVVGFEVIFSHTQEGGLFDRHILTAALPLVGLVCLAANLVSGTQHQSANGSKLPIRISRRASLSPACAILVVLAWFSITSTHDYLSWNRLRWELGNGLLATQVDPLRICGGFEFNAWHNYDTFRKRGNVGKVYYWWYDRPDFLITMEPQEAYRVLRMKEYFSWLHLRNLPVYLLERDSRS